MRRRVPAAHTSDADRDANALATGFSQPAVTGGVMTTDPRLSDERNPTDHASEHLTTDPIAVASTSSAGLMSAASLVKLNSLYVQPAPSITKEYTGFTSPDSVVINYDETTQRITLTGTVTAYHQGVLVTALASGWVSTAHANTTGHIYYLYFDGSTFVWATDSFPGFDVLLVASVHYRASDKFGLRESHGFMPHQTHEEFHRTVGTYLISGGVVSAIILNSTTAGDRRPDISQCVIADEDQKTTLPALTSKSYTLRYLAGSAVVTYTKAAAEIVPVLSANPYYNSFTTPNWGQTLMPSNSVMSVWLYAKPVTSDSGSQAYRFSLVQGQWVTLATSGSAPNIATAVRTELSRTSGELNLGDSALISAEYVCIARIVIKFVGANWSVDSVYAITGTKSSQTSAPIVGMTSVSATAPITGTGTPADPLVMAAATAAVNGYLAAADFETFTAKADDSAVVHDTGNETIGGVKTFTDGIVLGNETLTVYDEGTWVPDIRGSVTAGTNTYGIQNGTFTRIGRMVVARFRVQMTAKDAAMAGNALIGGLPITSSSATATVNSGVFGYISNVTLSASKIYLALRMGPNAVIANIAEVQSGAASSELPVANIAANTDLIGSITYFA